MKERPEDRIFSVTGPEEFADLSLEIFRYQSRVNPVYREFIEALGIDSRDVISPEKIPFMPVSFFRYHRVVSGDMPHVAVFESSGTTGSTPGRHFVTDLLLYRTSLNRTFEIFFGDPGDCFIAALLPSYTERGNSSLAYMVETLIGRSRDSRSGFFTQNIREMIKTIAEVKSEGGRAMLIGVSFALLDLAEKYSPDLSGVIVAETGGMKGRRREVTREELHDTLKKGLNLQTVYSEYGMTELLSQAWSAGDGIFQTPPWMRIVIRDSYDPLTVTVEPGVTGGINIIDLANLNSCSFIETGDIGRLHENGMFEVLGRFDNSDIRGCNLLYSP